MIFIFDIDSTLVKGETLEGLLELALDDNFEYTDFQKKKIVKEIEDITSLGMIGDIDFGDSLRRRLKVILILRKHIDFYNRVILPSLIDCDFKVVFDFLKNKEDKIFLISGGFVDNLSIVADKLDIDKKCLFANKFVFDGNVVSGFDKKSLLINSEGKVMIAEKIKRKYPLDKIICIGDGNTDYLMRKRGVADEFWGFWKNVKRDGLIKKADRNFFTVEELFNHLKSFRNESERVNN
jgi:D-3-phosphoglycerate dehydrogenase